MHAKSKGTWLAFAATQCDDASPRFVAPTRPAIEKEYPHVYNPDSIGHDGVYTVLSYNPLR